MVVLAALVTVGATLASGTVVPAFAETSSTCWQPPVEAPVVDPFRPPACPWCAGNRGIEYGSAPGDPVRAVAAGTVTFAGSVAGTFYVVIEHIDGLRATYGGLRSTSLAAGDPVVSGMAVGLAAGPLHFGLRNGEDYVDPTPLIGYWATRARLIPLDDAPARPAPAARLRCGARPPLLARG